MAAVNGDSYGITGDEGPSADPAATSPEHCESSLKLGIRGFDGEKAKQTTIGKLDKMNQKGLLIIAQPGSSVEGGAPPAQ
ncbi:hypothetical protein B0T17DRAFT_619491 [Bombardia bombarda]|uniref:Uncharacterized protein n=1 Tax=Bombardia bombarda TaxID=252184 RepID=A0AA39WI87_9PEZI|nr:hypothetical protein B0T17DRAFT_619491 [Bombardia bombarda]